MSTPLSGEELGWKIGIHLAFVFSGVLFALTDWLAARRRDKGRKDAPRTTQSDGK